MEGTEERIMKQNIEQQTLHNVKNQKENRLEKMIRFSGTCETIIKDLMFVFGVWKAEEKQSGDEKLL